MRCVPSVVRCVPSASLPSTACTSGQSRAGFSKVGCLASCRYLGGASCPVIGRRGQSPADGPAAFVLTGNLGDIITVGPSVVAFWDRCAVLAGVGAGDCTRRECIRLPTMSALSLPARRELSRRHASSRTAPAPAAPAPVPTPAPAPTWITPKRKGRRKRKQERANETAKLGRVADGVARLRPIYVALFGHELASVQPRGQGILMVSICSPNGCGVSLTSPINSTAPPTNGTAEEPDGLPECVTAARQLRRVMRSSKSALQNSGLVFPMTLACDNATLAILRTRPQWYGLWDSYMLLDTAQARRAYFAAGLLQERRQLQLHFLWKLMAQAMSPYEQTFYLDNDVLVLQATLAKDLLTNTLRVSDLVMPVDPVRQAPRTSASETRKAKQSRQWGGVAKTPPMYDMGIPPLCTCVMAYRRTPSVQRLLEGAAVRLALSLNPVDPTVPKGKPVIIRQSDQEMLWLELTQSPPDPLLRLFVLPEEYFCPAYWPHGRAASTKGVSFYEYVVAWSTQGKKNETSLGKRRKRSVVPRWVTGYRISGYPCKATHFHHSHTHLLETRPKLKASTVAAFEQAVGRGSRETAQTWV